MYVVLLSALVACGDDHAESPIGNCGGACPPDACGTTAPACGDGTCNGDETTATCVADCPAPPPPVCNTNGTCDAGETTENCAVDCPPAPACNNDNTCQATETATICAADCTGSLKVVNNSSYTIYYLYARECASTTWTANLIPTYLAVGQSYTLSIIPFGCWVFRAENSGHQYYWQTQNTMFINNMVQTWTLNN